MEKDKIYNFAMLITIAVVWGSSFILMKKGVEVYAPLQVGTLRIVISTLVLFPIAFKQLKLLKKRDILPIFVVGWIGTAIPAFLFPLAQTQVDSALAAMINTLVPLHVFILGILFFGTVFSKNKLIGIIAGLFGAFFLIFSDSIGTGVSINYYIIFILMTGVLYAISTNTIKKYAQNIPPLALTLAAFLSSAPIALIYLLSSDVHIRFFEHDQGPIAFFYIVLLAIFSTAMANVIFFNLTQRTNALFSSSVTYLIPIVATFWGVMDGESIGWNHLIGLIFILFGVYLVSRKK